MTQEEFKVLVEPLIKWINENGNPTTKILIDSTSAEVLDGRVGIYTEKFLVD